MQHTQPIHIHTRAHTNLYIHTRMCMTTYNIHSFTYRQCTTMLAYTYLYRAAAYLTHLCTAAHTCSHTVCVIHLHRDTHSHTKVNIIVLYTQICTRGASTIDILCRGRGQCRQYAQCSLSCSSVPTTAAKTCKKHLTHTHSCVILNT